MKYISFFVLYFFHDIFLFLNNLYFVSATQVLDFSVFNELYVRSLFGFQCTLFALAKFEETNSSSLLQQTFFIACYKVEIKRVELLTPCLQGRCSPNWAIPPYLAKATLFCFYFFQRTIIVLWKLNSVKKAKAFRKKHLPHIHHVLHCVNANHAFLLPTLPFWSFWTYAWSVSLDLRVEKWIFGFHSCCEEFVRLCIETFVFFQKWNFDHKISSFFLLRKEVIQPHLPIRLPCYDFTPIIEPTFGSALLPDRRSDWLRYWLRVFPTLMVWRAVCTRPGNVFTAVCWPAITSNSDFMKANFSLQSELRPLFLLYSSSRIRFFL